jgi:serine/threonine protein kinase
VHRDIKPDNVFLIDPEREIFVKVLDFGIAKSLHEELHVTSTGTMMGTPHYMSPEQMLSSKHVDFRADLWAVAVLTYHCLTGDVPFDGETFGAIAIAVAQGSFAPPYQLRGVGSPALDAWFVRALSRDPNARFSSASELSETLAAAVAAADGAPGVSSGDARQGAPTVRLSDSGAQSSMALTAPTFTGVANTLNRSGQGRKVALALAAAGLGVLGTVLAVVLFWSGRQQPDVEIERTSATASPSPSAPVTVAPSAASAPLPATPPPSASPPSASPPPSAAPPKAAPVRPPPVPVKPKPKPPAGDAAPRPERPDRGF